MQAFFSGTDDKYELGDPGIHIVVGSIDTQNMKYTIVASVVGSGRRFKVPYDKLIDATPSAGQEFHPKVIDYVDYSSPVTTYSVKGGYTKYPKTWTKKETPDKVKSKTYQNLGTWGWEDDYCNPFYWSDNYHSVPNKIETWNVADILKDFLLENQHNPMALKEMRDELYDFLQDLEVYLEPELQEI